MTSLSPLPGPADPDDNLVRYFAIHTVAVQAEGGSRPFACTTAAISSS
jgi:hypothetical protein